MAGNPRMAALAALEKYRREGAWSDAALSGLITKNGLDHRDAALASSLFYGVLQNLYFLDYYIDSFSSVKSAKMEPKVLDILRLAAYQILFMDRIPVSAAVNEGVGLCKALGYKKASGLVNAVSRRIAENRDCLPEIPDKGTHKYLSVRYSHPLWLVDELILELGYDGTEKLLSINNLAPPVTAQVNTLKAAADDVLNELGDTAQAHPLLPDCIQISRGGSLTDNSAFSSGKIYIQDAAARLAVMAAGPVPGQKVLDACAAPGGKSFTAAIMMENDGNIVSSDISAKKLARIEESALRLGIDIISTETMDAREPRPEYLNGFDAVIADAPCSGLGVIRKKPEIRYKEPTALSALPEIQFDILSGLAKCVAPGGILLYSTCTFRREENEEVIERFLKFHEEFCLDGFLLPSIGEVRSGFITLWPHLHDTDGFFICRMKRSGTDIKNEA